MRRSFVDVKQEAIKLFNETWDLMDLKERTPSQQVLILHWAHTTCYLWSPCVNEQDRAYALSELNAIGV